MKWVEVLQALVPILRDVVQVANNRILWSIFFAYYGLWFLVGTMAFVDVWFCGGQRFQQLMTLFDKL